jgi:hypothetical protein
MFTAIKEFFFGKPAVVQAPEVDVKVEAVNQAPYKVETPVVDLADIAIAQRPEPVVAPVAEAAPAPVVEEVKAAPAKKPAKMTASNKKPAAPKKTAGAKKGRKPKA